MASYEMDLLGTLGSFEHRKDWFEQRLIQFAGIRGIDLLWSPFAAFHECSLRRHAASLFCVRSEQTEKLMRQQDFGGDGLFVHIKSFVNRSRRPVELDVLTFEQSIGPDGRGQAVKVVFDGEPLVKPTLVPIRIVIAISFLLSLAALTITEKVSFFVAGLYATMSVIAFIAFIAYWMDKVAAINNHRRTPENTLLYLGIIGGWPGAIVAQQVFRHKTIKQSFQVGFLISVVVNCCVLVFLASPPLRAFIRSLG